MSNQMIFWGLVTFMFIEIYAIIELASAINQLLQSDEFKKRMKERNGKGGAAAAVLLLVVGSLFPTLSFGAEGDYTIDLDYPISNMTIYLMLTIDGLLMIAIYSMRRYLRDLLNAHKSEEQIAAEVKKVDIMQILTDTVAVEEEAAIELDHEYDGIRELDNNLPPWWKWGFYLTILISVVYLVNYHILGTGDLQQVAYEKDMAAAEIKIKAYLESQAMNVDEHSVTILSEPGDISTGKALYEQYCKVCHGGAGEGLVGPNLTDNYWIHGGGIADVFTTIKYGAENGMKSWQDELNPVEMQQVASFIKGLAGTNPPNAKPPQGDLYQEADAPVAPTAEPDSIPAQGADTTAVAEVVNE